ncbi:MAG: 30S ribosomal protein THX, partial [Bacteroidota bacterium]
MGKGDKKTRRGKLFSGSYGKRRPKKHFKSFEEAKKEPVKKEETKAPKPESKK